MHAMLNLSRGSRLSWPAFVAVVSCLVAPQAARAACDGTAVPTGAQSIDAGGLRRTFVVRPPSEPDAKGAAPVVIAFHPFGTGANYMVTRAPIGRFWPSALVIYPDGMPRDSSSPVPSWQNRSGELGDRDLTFFDAMVAWADQHACIDRSRVFVLGYSNGAGLAYLLGCERSAAVAGVAIAAGRMSCRPSAAKPVVMSHGTFDNTIAYEQAIEASKAWATANGCAAPPKTGTLGCTEAQSCASAPVSLCSYRGGHEYDTSFTRTAAEFLKAARK
jgi:polyhydroxybutyrate depolymerase